MRSANAGDSAAYHHLLRNIAPVLRATTRSRLRRANQPVELAEDIVQEILIAVHLKKHTWLPGASFAPWLFAIARNKLVDALRKRNRVVHVDLDDVSETLASEPVEDTLDSAEIARRLEQLPARQRDVLQAIAVESASIKATADRLAMTEGAVRVALHRGLTNLSRTT
jgi:RNA polymerase sigma-70 factor (ECF subfamily)